LPASNATTLVTLLASNAVDGGRVAFAYLYRLAVDQVANGMEATGDAPAR